MNLTKIDPSFEVVLRETRAEPKVSLRRDLCKALRYGEILTSTVADVSGSIHSIPGVGNTAVGIVTGAVSAASILMKGGMDAARTSLGCAMIPFEDLQELIENKLKDLKRKLEKQSDVMNKVANMVTKISSDVEKMRLEMRTGFEKIVDVIENIKIKEAITDINSFASYFMGEQNKIRNLSKDNYIAKLKEHNGLLSYLKSSITPNQNSLHTAMFNIGYYNMAIPKDENDENAFRALFALFYGIQIYASVFEFLMDSHSYIADYYYQTGEYEKFNEKIDTIRNIFNDFQHSLTSKNYGFILKVEEILKIVKSKDFIKKVNDPLYKEVADKSPLITKVKNKITSMILPIISETPEPPTLELKDKVIRNFGSWMNGVNVKYAVQYEKNGKYSKLSEWSDPFIIRQKACPFVNTDSNDKGMKKIIFRKFDDDAPQIAAVIEASETETRDVHRDLYDAVLAVDQDEGLDDANKALANGANVDMKFELGRTLMHAACISDNLKVVDRIMKEKVPNLNVKDKKGYSPLHLCAEKKRTTLIDEYKGKGADLNAVTRDEKYTPLHIAARFGHKDLVDHLLKEDVIEANAKDINGFSPLHWAAEGGVNVLKPFIASNKVDINAQSNVGLSLVHLVAMKNDSLNLQNIKKRKELKFNVVDKNNMSPMHYAAMLNNNHILKELMSVDNFDPNVAAAVNKWTPLHYAIYFKREQTALTLIKNERVNVALKAEGDVTPLHMAVSTDQLKIVEELLQRNVSLEDKTAQGDTALHVAAMTGDKLVVNVLIKKGSSMKARNLCIDTPADLARKFENLDLFRSLSRLEPQFTNRYRRSGLVVHNSTEIPLSFNFMLSSNSQFQPVKRASFQDIDTNGTLLLMDVLLRKLTNEKYKWHANENVPEVEASSEALRITESFEELLNNFSDSSVDEEIDLTEVYGRVKKALLSGRGSNVSQILCSYAEKFTLLKSEDKEFLWKKFTSNNHIITSLRDNLKNDFSLLLDQSCPY